MKLAECRDRPEPRFVGQVGRDERIEDAFGALGEWCDRGRSRGVGQRR
jgi:hypothetical protein